MEKEGTLGAVGVEHLSVPPGTLRARTGIQFYRVDIKSFYTSTCSTWRDLLEVIHIIKRMVVLGFHPRILWESIV